MNQLRTCNVHDCNMKHEARGLCVKHYSAWRRQQNPEYDRSATKQYRQANKQKIANKNKAYNRTTKARYKGLLKNAQTRGIEVELPYYVFEYLTKLPCFYCTGALPEVGYGLDRIDNSKGYKAGNVYSCCTKCNQLRRNLLTTEETIEVVQLLQKLRKRKKIWNENE